jgi:hypothetical protein
LLLKSRCGQSKSKAQGRFVDHRANLWGLLVTSRLVPTSPTECLSMPIICVKPMGLVVSRGSPSQVDSPYPKVQLNGRPADVRRGTSRSETGRRRRPPRFTLIVPALARLFCRVSALVVRKMLLWIQWQASGCIWPTRRRSMWNWKRPGRRQRLTNRKPAPGEGP